MPEKTARERAPDASFTTYAYDLAPCDANGQHTIVGRATHMTSTGGYNPYPKEVNKVPFGPRNA